MVTSSKPARRIYKVTFLNQGKVYEVYAASVSQGDLFGFIAVEELLFGEKTKVVVDPAEESLKLEFAGVKRTYVPLHAVLRIDEVEKPGAGRITDAEKGGKVTAFPSPIYSPGGDSKKS